MSEELHPQQLPAADLLAQHGLVVPNSVRSAGVQSPDATPVAHTSWADEPTADLPIVGHDGRAHDADPVDDVDDVHSSARPSSEALYPDDDPYDYADLDYADLSADNQTDNAATPDDADAVAADGMAAPVDNGPRRHQRPRDWSKLRYLNPAEAGRALKVKWETATTREKVKFAAGALAVGTAVVGAYALYKGYISDTGGDHSAAVQWHEPAATTDQTPDATQGMGPAGTSSPTGTEAGGVDTPAEQGTGTATRIEEAEDYSRTARGKDVSGRASNVTDWSRETIYQEAVDSGISKDEARQLASDQDNIRQANKAFYKDNATVANDAHHFMNEGDTYDTAGQHRAADAIIDDYKVEHGIDQPETSQSVTVDSPPEQPATEPQAATVEAEPEASKAGASAHGTTTPKPPNHNKEAGSVNWLVAAGVTGLAGMSTGGILASIKSAAERRQRDEEAEYRMDQDINDAASAGRNAEDIRPHRADEKKVHSHRRSNSQHVRPFRHSKGSRRKQTEEDSGLGIFAAH